jgi:hypothetical protein
VDEASGHECSSAGELHRSVQVRKIKYRRYFQVTKSPLLSPLMTVLVLIFSDIDTVWFKDAIGWHMKALHLHNPDVIGMNDGNNGKFNGLIDEENGQQAE